MIAFASAHGAVLARTRLEPDCPCMVAPVLREISMGCGMALRLAPEHLPHARKIVKKTLPPDAYAFYAVTAAGARPLVVAIDSADIKDGR